MMMVPSVNIRGGNGNEAVSSAFVAPHSNNMSSLFLQRQGTSISTAAYSSTASLLEDDGSFFRGGDDQQYQQRRNEIMIARQDEPNLYNFPSYLKPTYQPMSMLLQIFIAIVSAIIVTVGRANISQFLSTTTIRRTFIDGQLPNILQKLLLSIITSIEIRKGLWFLLRTAILSTIVKLSIQEVFYLPSRVTTKYLAERGMLPSKLSHYTTVKPVPIVSAPIKSNNAKVVVATTTSSTWKEGDDSSQWMDDVPSSIGVHSLQYTRQQQKTDNNNTNNSKLHDGIYFYHGFGASSLSWLPILPSLVKRIGNSNRGAIGIAHDAPGFGFTDRPNADIDGGLHQYGSESNVGIGVALMNESLAKLNNEAKKHIAIFGHSMGSKSALLMALYYASQQKQDIVPSLVVLVAPALEGVTLPSRRGYGLKSASRRKELLSNNSYWIRKLAKRVWIAWRKVFVDYPFRYGLRRLVW